MLSAIFGWTYFFSWSISFYPQIYDNWKRKSVVGLNFDFLALNTVGFVLYSAFNIGLYTLDDLQVEYFITHPNGVNPVNLNDVIFSVHATVACAITLYQCALYEKGHQKVSRACKCILVGIFLYLFIWQITCGHKYATQLSFLYVCSYVKLFITLTKYIPQAYMNYSRKSTIGWSIGNVLLDFLGGILSIGQMFVDAYNNDGWDLLLGDPTKLGLGLFSACFDVFFLFQHYMLYSNKQKCLAKQCVSEVEEGHHDD